MPKLRTPPITPPQDADTQTVSLHRRVIGAFQNLVMQINDNPFTKDPAPDNLDMAGHRILGVGTPSSDGDAVNLGFLKRSFKGGQQGAQGTGGGDAFYEIVFSNGSDITTGSTVSPAYNVGIDRTGQPIEANISALVPPVGASIKANFVLNGTTTLLATDLTLPAGTSTVVSATNFSGSPVFAHNDMVTLVINQVGSSTPGSLVSIGLVVRRS